MVNPLAADAVVADTYKIVRVLGTPGVASTLYQAEQLGTGRAVALRVFSPEVLAGEGARARFDAAVKVRAGIKSPHVVDLLAAGVWNNTPWMALELLEGRTLHAALEEAGKKLLDGETELDEPTVLEELGGALAAIHAAGQVHGPLDPRRIFLARRGRAGEYVDVVLLDFWSAALTRDIAPPVGENPALPLWSAPELLGGSDPEARSDIWSYGLLAFRLHAGVNYWKSGTGAGKAIVAAVQKEITTARLVPASERTAHRGRPLPPGFDAWFARCVARVEDDRFASMDDAMEALEALADEPDAPVAPAPAVKSGSPRAGATTAAPARRGAPEPQDTPWAVRFPRLASVLRNPDMAVPLGLGAALLLALGVRAEVRHWRRTHRHGTTPVVAGPTGSSVPSAPAMVTAPTDTMPNWQAGSDGAIVYPNTPEPTSPDPIAGAWTMVQAMAGMPGTGPITADIETNKGTITCTLIPERAPLTVANFIGLARGIRPWWDPVSARWVRRPYYEGSVFHKVLPGMWIQGGDILRAGVGSAGYTFRDENTAPHDEAGLLCSANHGPDTNSSQFFILATPRPLLDGRYPVFGRCGPMEIVHEIENVPADNNRPRQPVFIRHVTIHRR